MLRQMKHSCWSPRLLLCCFFSQTLYSFWSTHLPELPGAWWANPI
jgi:hypothetical protein